MSLTRSDAWKKLRDEDSEQVEKLLRTKFKQADSYRYNVASVRVRVIDPAFEGLSDEARDALVEPLLDQLPEAIQSDIMNLLTLAPSEIGASIRNLEFEDPSPSSFR